MREILQSINSTTRDKLSNVGIAVVGSGPFFTRQTCNHLENEFDTGCVRLNSLDELDGITEELTRLRLVVIDETLADDLLARPEAYREINSLAAIALGYRDIDTARRFHESLDPAVHGAVGYLPLNAPFEVVLSTIRLLLHKELFVPACLIRTLSERKAEGRVIERVETEPPCKKDADTEFFRLTDRERQVLRRASVGESNKMIARALSISEHTVKLHMHNVYEKLNVSNRTAAASLYLATNGGRGGTANRPA